MIAESIANGRKIVQGAGREISFRREEWQKRQQRETIYQSAMDRIEKELANRAEAE